MVLNLIAVKPEFIKELKDLEVKEGDPARLKCKLKADPAPAIEWLVDDDKIRKSNRIHFEFDGENATLFITTTYPEDEGEYTCKASNVAGSELTRAELIVNGKLSIVKLTDFGRDISGSRLQDNNVCFGLTLLLLQNVYLERISLHVTRKGRLKGEQLYSPINLLRATSKFFSCLSCTVWQWFADS